MAAEPKALLKKWITGKNAKGEVRGYCPMCEDPETSQSDSGSFNFDKGVFHCFAGCGGLSISDLLSIMRNDGSLPRSTAGPKDKTKKADDDTEQKPSRPLPTEAQLERFVERLQSNAEQLRILRRVRGLTSKTLRRFQIGYDGERYTIPVRDADGKLVNVRRYRPKTKDPRNKMVSWARGIGNRRLFLPEVLKGNDTVILVEGEMDAIIGQQYGLPTMSHTAGAIAWNPQWNLEFEGKTVFICYDCDDGGRRGARKVEGQLAKIAKRVHIITLPLQEKGADLTNYFVDQGFGREDFETLMDEARAKVSRSGALAAIRLRDPREVTLEDSMDATYHGQPISFVATVAGKVQPAYVTPKRIEYNCNEGGGTRCQRCPISGRNHLEVDIPEHDTLVLDLVNKNTEHSRKTMLSHAGIPSTCPDVEIDETEMYSVEELIVVPPADQQVGQVNPLDRRVFNVGKHATTINQKVGFVGLPSMDRSNRRSALQTWASDPKTTDLEDFEMTDELYEKLQVFRPDPGQRPLDRLYEIAADIEANVTRIYGRPELHIAYDLVWHSALDFLFKGVQVGKGWLELLVIGDTRTGKSEAASRLCHHYRAGVLTTCEGATFAGLVGGAQQLSGNWMVSWGTIPLNDRRLVVLDEFGGLAGKGIIEQMSSVRSSGIAQINKIVQNHTNARTRLIWIANPADGRKIEEFGTGAVEAVRTLANNPEDIARFDLAMTVASGEVDMRDINTSEPPQVKHRFTSDLCGALVCWAWSRCPDQIVWREGVEDFVLERAMRLGKKYIPEPPLIQVENVRLKLARVAVAVAARVFSTDETGEVISVGKRHVQAAERLLHTFYQAPAFGYYDHSQRILADRRAATRHHQEISSYLRERQDDVLVALLGCMGSDFRLRDFTEFAGMSQMDAQDAVRVLQVHHMIRRQSKGYIRMEPTLTAIIKQLERELEN